MRVVTVVFLVCGAFNALSASHARAQDCSPTYTFTGEAADDRFGWSVSGAGDVNNDGYADVIVGAYRNDAGGGNAGRAYVYSGLTGALLFTFTGEAAGDYFGRSVSGAEDVDNDGYADLIVGAPYYRDGGGIWVGRAYVFFGGPGPFPISVAAVDADYIFTGEPEGGMFGNSVSGAGDVDNDGYPDLIVGAYRNDAMGDLTSRAYVYSGRTGALLYTFSGEAWSDYFGYSVSGAGDVDNDGHADLIVGAFRNDGGGTDAGRAYVFFGGPGPFPAHILAANADIIITGEAAGDFFGLSVSGAGDVDNDEYADVIVGAHKNDAGGYRAGRAYVYSGRTGALLHTFTGEAEEDGFGWPVSDAGDVDNDGYADLIVGAQGNDACGFNAGAAYVYSGRTGALLYTFSGEAEEDLFGISLSGAGDIDADGYADLIVGGWLNDAGGSQAGRAYVFTCRSGPQPTDIPVVLVHGWKGKEETWDNAKTYLQNAGFRHVWVASTIDKCGVPGKEDFEGNAQNLANFIRDTAAASGCTGTRINIVAHSMGGLIARRLLATPGEFEFTFSVENLIMLGTPNNGTLLARPLCVSSPSWCFHNPIACLYRSAAGAFVCRGSANCEMTPRRMEEFNGTYRKPAGVSFTGIAGTIALGLCNTCLVQVCKTDGIVANSSVRTCDDGFLKYYERQLFHIGPFGQTIGLANNEALFTELVIPTLLGNPPDESAVFAQSSPDSAVGHLFHGMYLLSDSVAWVADTIAVEPGSLLEMTSIALNSNIEVELEDPLGSLIDSALASSDSTLYYANELGICTYGIADPMPGDWIVRVRTSNWQDTIAPVLILGFVENDVGLTFYDERPEGELGDSVILRARLFEGTTPILGATVTVAASLDSDTLSWEVTLLDDGQGLDQAAADGLYSGAFTEAQVPGYYGFNCEANGLNGSNEPFTRFAVLQTYIIGHARGDLNADGIFDVFDVVLLVDHVFRNGPPPYPAFVADVTCNGVADVFDVVTLVGHIFREAPQPTCP